jgi:glutathione synthase/RimK-type ligase-like ATP-grasp enzyme
MPKKQQEILKSTEKKPANIKDKVYIYYSGPCRQTGEALVEALGVSGGDSTPKQGAYSLVIGYGVKTSKDVNLGKCTVLNHPNFVRINRNKFEALKLMKQAGINVAPFVDSENVLKALADKKSGISLPLIGRRNYHQGGKGFHNCMTERMIKIAINEEDGAQYFQNFIDIENEYRVHVFDGKVILMQKKVPRDNMAEAFIEQHSDKIVQTAERAGKKLDKDTMDYVLAQTGSRVLEKPDGIIRSNSRGWKFSIMNTASQKSNHMDAIRDMAIRAVAAVGLDFGAVDMCCDYDKKCFVLEVNTGPGLKESALDAYIKVLSEKITSVLSSKDKDEAPKAIDKVRVMVAETADGKDIKKAALARLALLSDLINNADEDDVPSIERAAARLFR